jgi:hypothetical protein
VSSPYDCIFDFSASSVGGGLTRLREYAKYFDRANGKVLFLAHPAVREHLQNYKRLTVEFLPRPSYRRILHDGGLVDKYKGKASRYFSYGIPLYQRMSPLDWMHLSNALPFGYAACTLSRRTRAKNWLLLKKFKRAASHPDIVSAESRFLLDLYGKRCGLPKEAVLSRNGID